MSFLLSLVGAFFFGRELSLLLKIKWPAEMEKLESKERMFWALIGDKIKKVLP